MDNEFVEPKSNKGLYAVIVFLILIVIGLGGYLVYDNFIKNDKEDSKDIKDNSDDLKCDNFLKDSNNTKEKISIADAETLLNYYWSSDTDCMGFTQMLLLNEDYKAGRVAKILNYSLFDGIENCSVLEGNIPKSAKCDSGFRYVSYEKANGLYHLLFGYDEDIAKNQFGSCDNAGYYYFYNEKLNAFMYLETTGGCGGTCASSIKRTIKSSVIENNILTISFDTYIEHHESEPITKEENSYNAVFKKGSVNYYLDHVEKIK